MRNTPEVTISLHEYEELLEDSYFLNALNQVGVDNWDGYEEANKLYEDMNESLLCVNESVH